MSDNPILMARIGAPHGVRGEVRVKSFAADPVALGDYGKLFDAQGRKFEIKAARPSKTVLVVKFAGVNSREAAEALNGVELFVDRSALPEPEEDEFYYSDLIGMTVTDAAGEPIGALRAIEDYGSGDVLEITLAKGGSELVMFTRDNVPEIDMDARTITVVMPDTVEARENADEAETAK